MFFVLFFDFLTAVLMLAEPSKAFGGSKIPLDKVLGAPKILRLPCLPFSGAWGGVFVVLGSRVSSALGAGCSSC